MGTLKLPVLSLPGFTIIAEQAEQNIVLRFHGTADMSAIEPLDDHLRMVHAEATAQAVIAVVVDLRSLEFMNSSCFKAFVDWLGMVQDLPPAERYNVVFDSNRDMHWQRRSLNALRSFAMDVVTIEAR